MKKLLPVLIAIVTIATVMIAGRLSREAQCSWTELNAREKRVRIVLIAAGIVVLGAGIGVLIRLL